MHIHPIVRKEFEDKQTITIDGYQMTYLTAGNPENTPVVMVHGWLYHAGMWRGLMNALSADYYCIAVDLLGHGHSDKPHSADYSIRTSGQRVLDLVSKLGYEQFIYIGHSMGGMIGANIAARQAPERIIKLIDVSGILTGKPSRYVRLIHEPLILLGWLVPKSYAIQRFCLRFKWYRQLLADNVIYWQRGLSIADSADIQMAVIHGMEVTAYKLGRGIKDANLTSILDKVAVPTLIIFGEQDNTVPIAQGYLALEHIPNSRMIIYQNCSHMPQVEAAKRFHADIRAFIAEPIREMETS